MALAELFDQEIGKRIQFASQEKTASKALAEQAVAQIYSLLERPAPAVIWCQSIYQLATLPPLLIGLFYSEAWQICSSVLANRQADDVWLHDYEEAWEAIWAHGGRQLMEGILGDAAFSFEFCQRPPLPLVAATRERIDE